MLRLLKSMIGHKSQHRWRRACLATCGIGVLMFGVFVPPAAADQTAVGPCDFRLDNPHLTTDQVAVSNPAVVRVHSAYRCSSEVAYATAKVSLRYCGSEPLAAEACPVLNTRGATDTFAGSGIHHGPSWKSNFTTTDSDPYPESGWYVATALYEVCLFNSGVISGTGISQYLKYDATTGKVQFAKDAQEAVNKI